MGRLLYHSTSNAATVFSYDPKGRVAFQYQCLPPNCNNNFRTNYSYDLAGNMTTFTDAVGETYTQTFDTAGRVTQLNSSWVDAQHPATLATVDSSVGYFPTGQIRKMTFGNGLTQAMVYNPQLQPCRINLNSSGSYFTTWSDCSTSVPTGNQQDLQMNWNGGAADNGSLIGLKAAGQQNFNRTFTYDSLNRVATMQETTGSAEGCKPSSSSTNPYTLSWGYDPWGNRTSQSPSAGTCSFSQSVNTQNQFVGPPYQYDAAGNMTYDGSHAYFYDAENRLLQIDGTFGTCSTATACYVYDAVGRRVQKSLGAAQTNYIYGLDGHVVSEVDQNRVWKNVYLHMQGLFVAQYSNGQPLTQFVMSDHLGSPRVLTKYDGTLADSLDFLPFGEQIAGASVTTHKFTDDERDSESGLDHTWFRQYSSSLARWMHPDPVGLAAVDPANPQSWNRFSYVLDNPTDLTDPSGLGPKDEGPGVQICWADGTLFTGSICNLICPSGFYAGGSGRFGIGGRDCLAISNRVLGDFVREPKDRDRGNTSGPATAKAATHDQDMRALDDCRAAANAAYNAETSPLPNASSILSGALGAFYNYVVRGATVGSAAGGFAVGFFARPVANANLRALAYANTYNACVARVSGGPMVINPGP